MTFALSASLKKVLVVTALLLAFAMLAQAQRSGGGLMSGGDLPSTTLPPNLSGVSIDQKLGAQIPLDLQFKDESGRDVTLAKYFQSGRPVVLNLVYYDCPMLCTEVLNNLSSTFRLLTFDIGKDYEVVTVSFDPREKPELAAAKKSAYLQRLGRPGAETGWHFLTGSQKSTTTLTDAVGFHYQWDEKLQQYAHATAIMVATPEGKLSHYFYGVEYPPKDLRLALVEASNRKIGNPVDAVLLYCYHYDPRTGRYGAVVTNIVRLSGAATLLILGTFLIVMFRKESKGKRQSRSETILGR